MLTLTTIALLALTPPSPVIATGIVVKEADGGFSVKDRKVFQLVTTNIEQLQFLRNRIGQPVVVTGRQGERAYWTVLLLDEVKEGK